MTQTNINADPLIASAINKAISLSKNGEKASAIDILTRLLADFPEASSLHTYLAFYLNDIGHHSRALVHSQKATSLAPRSELASLSHFFALWDSGRQYDAFEEMKRFVLIRPSDEYRRLLRDFLAEFPDRDDFTDKDSD